MTAEAIPVRGRSADNRKTATAAIAAGEVQQLANGHILMFDNGLFRPDGDYSRALELALDFDTMTARAVWQYRAHPDISSHVFGNVVQSVPVIATSWKAWSRTIPLSGTGCASGISSGHGARSTGNSGHDMPDGVEGGAAS